MEPLLPADQIIPELDIKPEIRLAFVGDVDYYSKDIIKAARSPKEPHYFSMQLSLPSPDGAVDFIFAWLLRSIQLEIITKELTRICSPSGTIWIVVWQMKEAPPNIPDKFSVIQSMAGKKWFNEKDVSLSKDYLAIKFTKRK